MSGQFTEDGFRSKFRSYKPESGVVFFPICCQIMVGWLVVLGLTALCDSISVYIGPSHREREKEK